VVGRPLPLRFPKATIGAAPPGEASPKRCGFKRVSLPQGAGHGCVRTAWPPHGVQCPPAIKDIASFNDMARTAFVVSVCARAWGGCVSTSEGGVCARACVHERVCTSVCARAWGACVHARVSTSVGSVCARACVHERVHVHERGERWGACVLERGESVHERGGGRGSCRAGRGQGRSRAP
jgi:hypothetical protein